MKRATVSFLPTLRLWLNMDVSCSHFLAHQGQYSLNQKYCIICKWCELNCKLQIQHSPMHQHLTLYDFLLACPLFKSSVRPCLLLTQMRIFQLRILHRNTKESVHPPDLEALQQIYGILHMSKFQIKCHLMILPNARQKNDCETG